MRSSIIFICHSILIISSSLAFTNNQLNNKSTLISSKRYRQTYSSNIKLFIGAQKNKCMLHRNLTSKLKQLGQQFPVIAVVGPKKSGKSTLAQLTFPQYNYVSLEDFDIRKFAKTDPRQFLDQYNNGHGIILDEIQHTPELLSYIQTDVDRTQKNGSFILISSQNFLFNPKTSQSLAGRMAILTLLPLSMTELRQINQLSTDIHNIIFQGSYPSIFTKNSSPTNWYRKYVRNYIERDVRQIKNIYDLEKFQQFMKSCANRIGQILNVSSLAKDCDISVNTANSWLSLLQTSYIVFLLYPHPKSFGKRQTKTPKLYFYDTGLASFFLEIDNPKQLATHYLRGGLFESYIISELIKLRYNVGRVPHYYFWRDKIGHEVDLIIDHAGKSFPVEIKSGQTISQDYFEELHYWTNIAESQAGRNYCIYSGSEN